MVVQGKSTLVIQRWISPFTNLAASTLSTLEISPSSQPEIVGEYGTTLVVRYLEDGSSCEHYIPMSRLVSVEWQKDSKRK